MLSKDTCDEVYVITEEMVTDKPTELNNTFNGITINVSLAIWNEEWERKIADWRLSEVAGSSFLGCQWVKEMGKGGDHPHMHGAMFFSTPKKDHNIKKSFVKWLLKMDSKIADHYNKKYSVVCKGIYNDSWLEWYMGKEQDADAGIVPFCIVEGAEHCYPSAELQELAKEKKNNKDYELNSTLTTLRESFKEEHGEDYNYSNLTRIYVGEWLAGKARANEIKIDLNSNQKNTQLTRCLHFLLNDKSKDNIFLTKEENESVEVAEKLKIVLS